MDLPGHSGMRGGRAAAWAARAALIIAACALAGCQGNTLASRLRAAGVGGAPDEFLVLPTKPLEMPQDLAALPPPTPGGANLVDPQPEADAVAALTGRPGAPGSASGAVLVARAGPIQPGVRGQLAKEDAVYREENQGRLLERLFNRDAPNNVIYEDQMLDAEAEFLRQRALGVRVPAAPPLQ